MNYQFEPYYTSASTPWASHQRADIYPEFYGVERNTLSKKFITELQAISPLNYVYNYRISVQSPQITNFILH